ncbi:MAG: DUF4867 family protein [Spirochaetia bacterium]|jgi:ureidoglycolate lyase|nr:DUF4867 family protein [Spirochaetia bacterium]
MKKIKAKKLSVEGFSNFGSYYNLIDVQGNNLGDFFPDHILNPTEGTVTGFSALKVYKKEKMIIEAVEFHNHTGEIILPLDSDIVIHVAPPNIKPILNQTEAFIVPKGTIVRLNVGVFHLAPFSIEKETGHVMIALPERTYINDCTVITYDENSKIEITL